MAKSSCMKVLFFFFSIPHLFLLFPLRVLIPGTVYCSTIYSALHDILLEHIRDTRLRVRCHYGSHPKSGNGPWGARTWDRGRDTCYPFGGPGAAEVFSAGSTIDTVRQTGCSFLRAVPSSPRHPYSRCHPRAAPRTPLCVPSPPKWA